MFLRMKLMKWLTVRNRLIRMTIVEMTAVERMALYGRLILLIIR